MEEDSISLRTEWDSLNQCKTGQTNRPKCRNVVSAIVFRGGQPLAWYRSMHEIYYGYCNCRWFQTLPNTKHMRKFLFVSWEPVPLQESFISMDVAYEVMFLRRRNVNKQLIRKLFDEYPVRFVICKDATLLHATCTYVANLCNVVCFVNLCVYVCITFLFFVHDICCYLSIFRAGATLRTHSHVGII